MYLILGKIDWILANGKKWVCTMISYLKHSELVDLKHCEIPVRFYVREVYDKTMFQNFCYDK